MLEKLKQLSKDTAVYGISTMFGRLLNFLLVPFYTNVFLPEQYGIISNIYAFIGILNILFLYGMDSAYLKYGSDKDTVKNRDSFSTSYLTILISSVFLCLVIILLNNPIAIWLDVPVEFFYLINIMAGIVFFDAITNLPFIKLRLERKAKKFAAFKILNISVNVALNLYLILVLEFGIEAVFFSNLAASAVSFILLLPDIFKEFKSKINREILRKLFKFGLPYLPAGIAAMIIQVIDVPILKQLTDFETVGIYKACYKLGIFMMLFVTMFQFAWQPFFLQQSKSGDAKQLFSKVFTYFTIIGSFILVILSLFINDIVTIEIFGRSIIDKDYWSGLPIVPLVLLGYLFNGFYIIFTAGIYIEEKSFYAPIITGIGAVVNIGANYLLIPILGIMGAAWATLLSYLAMAAGLYIVTQKFYKVDYELWKICKVFLLIFLVGILYYSFLLGNENVFFYKIILLAFFTGAMFLFAIDKNERNFLKKRIQNRS